jgi:Uncharacterised protein family (UPF0259)
MERKLDIGATLNQTFSTYGAQAGTLLPLALLLFLVVAIVNWIIAGSFWLFPVGLAVSVIAATLYQGMVVNLVSDVQDGRRDRSIEDLVRETGPVVLPLIGVGILAGIAIGIGFLLLIVPGLILVTIWSVIAPVIVVEHAGVFESFGRSRELVRGNGWQVFGVIVVVYIIVFVIEAILGGIGSGLSDSAVIRIVFNLAGETIAAPIAALVAAVLYFRLRALREQAPSATPPEPPPGSSPPPPPPPPPPPGAAPVA